MSFNVVVIICILFSVNSFSQSCNDTVAYISKYPVEKGYIYLWKDKIGSIADPATVVCIYSADRNVVAVKGGQVKKIFTGDEFDSILITDKDTTILYANMDKFYKKVGDTIHKGDLIGTIKKDSADDRFQLFFKITVGRKDVFYNDHIKFLQQLH
ncbi:MULTISPECIES: peptidoglycan DD-metalloendopeptidase family protein [Niastella]|uniref:Peptidoglycan DD-metalloendopeptidase family protein n=1 Tax=Niastella soli TaxID=2821487 RepID=A0ABS3YZN5_9BACT|nr:M23 family metallopeptidase [Niastella soli]MBO9203391.1 peptidoglycan DD-metalloendopeptidase family protein [Niastella soli]